MINFFREFFEQVFESVPVVDQGNRVVGKISRVGSFLLMKGHRSVSVFLFRDGNLDEMLIQKRRLWMRFPGKWAECAGAVPYGFASEAAAYKEMREELFSGKMPLIRLKQIAEYREDAIRPFVFTTLFLGIFAGPFFPSRFEVAELAWVRVEDLQREVQDPRLRKKYAPPFVHAFQEFLEWRSRNSGEKEGRTPTLE